MKSWHERHESSDQRPLAPGNSVQDLEKPVQLLVGVSLACQKTVKKQSDNSR